MILLHYLCSVIVGPTRMMWPIDFLSFPPNFCKYGAFVLHIKFSLHYDEGLDANRRDPRFIPSSYKLI